METIEYAYTRYCEERFPLPSERAVAHLERHLHVRFPPDYREFLLRFNGGFFTEPEIEPTTEGCPVDRLTFMKGIGATHKVAELGTQADLVLFDDNWPPQILPAGYTIMGNLIFLIVDPDPEDWGCICLKKASSSESFFLADGIAEFFELLRDPPKD